jgi:hypothetical protein
MKKSFLVILIALLLSSCVNPDWKSDDYSEELTNQLFLHEADEKLLTQVHSIKIYRIKSAVKVSGWHSEEWLQNNSINSVAFSELPLVRKFIVPLRYEEPSSGHKKFLPSGVEYHIIVQLKKGPKAYLRIMEGMREDSVCKAQTYTNVSYRVRKEVDQNGFVMFSQIGHSELLKTE